MRHPLVVFVLAAVIATMSVAGPAHAAGRTYREPSTLHAGHCIGSARSDGYPELTAAHGEIELEVFNGQLTLSDSIDFHDGAPGYEYPYANLVTEQQNPPVKRSSSLCMLASGDLVFRNDAKTVWHTKTAGRAPGGYAQILDDGRLIVRTPSKHTVWATHTTRVLLGVGDRLLAGQDLYNRIYPGRTTRLEMTRGGDLVLRLDGRIVWRSHTHLRGSYFTITSAGRMAVASRTGHTMWHSGAVGKNPVFRLAEDGRIVIQDSGHNRRCVQYGRAGDCDAG